MDQKTKESLKPYGKMALIGLILILFYLTLPPAQAVEMKALQVSQYSFDAPTGYVIYQILVDPMPMGSNQSHTFTVGEATYYLNIETSNPYSIYYNFDISLTFPNGTTTTTHKGITSLPGAKYKINIEPVYLQAEGVIIPIVQIGIDIGITQNALSVNENLLPLGAWSPSETLPFTSVAGNFNGVKTNIYIYEMSLGDFQEHVVTYDPIYGLKNLANTVFQWVWENIIGFINQIPGIGPLFVSIIIILVAIAQEFIFWIIWILQNIQMIIASVEITICMLAVLFAEKRPKPKTVMKNIFRYNVAVVTGFIWSFNLIYTWLRNFIELIAHIVQALKPI